MVRRKQVPINLPRVRESYHRQMVLLVDTRVALERVLRDYAEAHDAGLSALRSGTGKLGSRSNGSDTTAQGGFEFQRLQKATDYAGRQVLDSQRSLERAIRSLERAGDAIHGGWLDTDPDLGKERRERYEAATQASLTLNPPPVTLPPVVTHDGA